MERGLQITEAQIVEAQLMEVHGFRFRLFISRHGHGHGHGLGHGLRLGLGLRPEFAIELGRGTYAMRRI